MYICVYSVICNYKLVCTVEPLYSRHPWSEPKWPLQNGDLYRRVPLDRKGLMQTDSTAFGGGVASLESSICRGVPLYATVCIHYHVQYALTYIFLETRIPKTTAIGSGKAGQTMI